MPMHKALKLTLNVIKGTKVVDIVVVWRVQRSFRALLSVRAFNKELDKVKAMINWREGRE